MANINTAVGPSGSPSSGGSVSPKLHVPPKNVAFELLFPDSPQYRARLPMRVQIYPHDDTESIVTTVKNFYGLYSGPTTTKGVSFEDEHGNTLIARYENFRDHMVVYVRVFEESPPPSAPFPLQYFPQAPKEEPANLENKPQMVQDAQRQGRDISRPASRASQRQSLSPGAPRGRRSASASGSVKKGRSRSAKNRTSMDGDAYSESMNGYSSGDGAASSTSAKNKDHLLNTDISVENIVQGGRRKRAKFESSELPLFAPPQMPAATSNPSVSPARRVERHRLSIPFVPPSQNPFTNPRPLQSAPNIINGFGHSSMYATPGPDGRRSRNSVSFGQNGTVGNGASGILPTPDPTVGSCMSEEDKDVAIQLMRLGEMSNVSHGRTSASTMDDTFSGRADAASSTGATSDGDSESDDGAPAARRQKLDAAGAAKPVYHTTNGQFIPALGSTEVSGDEADYEVDQNGVPKAQGTTKDKIPSAMSKPSMPKVPKAQKPSNGIKAKKLPAVPGVPVSPLSMPHSRKPSVGSMTSMPPPGGDDHPDLSTKPRCQRCRKSKKGCDRQRPCGRCRDAGLSADQCVSEDEGNGRKGRFGRHMGVPIKSDEAALPPQPALLPAATITMGGAAMVDKSKKRKR